MPPFPRVGRLSRGYAPGQVDAYLAQIETGFASGRVTTRTSASAIRRAAFDLVLHGYDPAAVDTWLDALETRALALEALARQEPEHDLGAEAGVLLSRLAQPAGARFPRRRAWARGYAAADVDGLLDDLAPALRGTGALEADSVRASVFTERLGGYDEDAVDDYLDRVVDLSLRTTTPPPESA